MYAAGGTMRTWLGFMLLAMAAQRDLSRDTRGRFISDRDPGDETPECTHRGTDAFVTRADGVGWCYRCDRMVGAAEGRRRA